VAWLKRDLAAATANTGLPGPLPDTSRVNEVTLRAVEVGAYTRSHFSLT